MNKTPVTFCALILLPLCLSLASGEEPPNPLQVLQGAEKSFGQVQRETMLAWNFQLKNRGSSPLRLATVKSGCSHCPGPSLPRYELAPGETMSATIELPVGETPGAHSYQLFLKGQNAQGAHKVVLTARWEVAPFLNWKPRQWSVVRPWKENRATTVTFDWQGMSPQPRLLDIQTSPSWVKMKRVDGEGEKSFFRLTVPDDAPPGQYAGWARARFEDSPTTEALIALTIHNQGPFQCQPRIVHFSKARPNRTLRLMPTARHDYRVTGWESDLPGLQVKIERNLRGEYLLRLSGAVESARRPGKNTLRIQTTAPAQPEIVVPLYVSP